MLILHAEPVSSLPFLTCLYAYSCVRRLTLYCLCASKSMLTLSPHRWIFSRILAHSTWNPITLLLVVPFLFHATLLGIMNFSRELGLCIIYQKYNNFSLITAWQMRTLNWFVLWYICLISGVFFNTKVHKQSEFFLFYCFKL